ncbi:hypothetical protein FNV43_RR00597 [Rhamnella rubrinervis]|uniref:Uncharacterized protein n=1 Tax=Rhamnella rubrinervis TaxID=2594499 RepID=A0A8K0HQY7_9ROSA|nr:hypothetical protein FNV43_RR00597 [Rhamnella rubrinervis]
MKHGRINIVGGEPEEYAGVIALKKTHIEDGDHSRRTTRSQRGKEPSEDLDSTDEYTPVKERTAKPYHHRKIKHYHTLRKMGWGDFRGRTGDWFGEVDETPFVDEIIRVDTLDSLPKVHCNDGIAIHGIT